MKYMFFDCFAGFTSPMAAAALADMTDSGELFSKIVSSLPQLSLNLCEVKRCSMEAAFADFLVSGQSKSVKSDELLLLCGQTSVGSRAHSQLERFFSIRAEARSIDPAAAEFDLKSELPVIVSAAYVFETLNSLEAEKVCVSQVMCSDAHTLGENGFSPVTKAETLYICNKYGISLKSSFIESELITEDGAALLAVLGAVGESAPGGNVIKIGYGAGTEDFDNVPNLVRAVYGEEDGSAILFEAESAFSDMFTEFAVMEG